MSVFVFLLRSPSKPKTKNLILFKQIPCVGLSRVEGFSWTVDGSAVCVWEGSQGMCRLQVYGVETGELMGNFEHSPGGVMSGIKTMAWAQSGQFLALSCFDDKVSCIKNANAGTNFLLCLCQMLICWLIKLYTDYCLFNSVNNIYVSSKVVHEIQ